MAFTGMSDKEIAEYRKYFWKQDTSGDGRLNKDEFENMMKSLGVNLSARELTKAFNAADKDGSGSITFNEFANTYLNKNKNQASQLSTERVLAVYRENDIDGDGSLTKEECLNAMKMLGKNFDARGLQRIMHMMDKDRDGGVSYTEFCRFLEL